MKYVVNQFMLKLVSSTEIRRRLKKNKEIIPGVKIALLNYLDLRSKWVHIIVVLTHAGGELL